VCLLYQEIDLSWDCVFIVLGDRAIMGMCDIINTLTQDSSPDTINTLTQDGSTDTINTHTQDSSPDTINTLTQVSCVCLFIVS
jgi:hypothetical protein